jgi:hypothetical protein
MHDNGQARNERLQRENQERVEKAMERFEAAMLKPQKRRKWGKMKHDGVRIPLNEPRRTAEPRETAEMFNDVDDIPGAGQISGGTNAP